MKCDELKATEIYARFAEEVYDDFGDSPQEQEYYRKEHADAAIAELKAENRRLKRALWLARYWRARCEMDYWGELCEHHEEYYHVKTNENLSRTKCECMIEKWIRVQNKLITKAEEYK